MSFLRSTQFLNILSKSSEFWKDKKISPILIFFHNFSRSLYILPLADVERRRQFAEAKRGKLSRRRDSAIWGRRREKFWKIRIGVLFIFSKFRAILVRYSEKLSALRMTSEKVVGKFEYSLQSAFFYSAFIQISECSQNLISLKFEDKKFK